MSITDDELRMRANFRKADAAERRERLLRRFTREATSAALVLCGVGFVGLVACVVGQYDLTVGGSSDYDVTHVRGGTYAIRKSSYDLTTLFLGMGAAGFASSLIISGGVLGQLRRLPPGRGYLVGVSAVVSLAGLLVLAVTG